jgi:hypothetical protein
MKNPRLSSAHDRGLPGARQGKGYWLFQSLPSVSAYSATSLTME